jgi:hypothetical protein
MSDEFKKEAFLPGTAQEVIQSGCDNGRGILTEFTASMLQPNNFSGAIFLPLSATPMVLAALTGAQALSLNAGDRVWLTGTIGWQALADGIGTSRVDVIFRIFRNTPVNGPQILSIRESAESSFDTFKAVSFHHVDINPVFEDSQLVSYFLTAELPLAGSKATVIGPISFTAAELKPNPQPPCL